MKEHRHANVKNLFYLVLLVSFILFAVACGTTDMGSAGTAVNVMGHFDNTSTAILLVGYPIAIALFYIGLCMHR